MNEIRPYRIDIPQADVDDLRDRLRRTRFADALPGVEGAYGVPVDQVQRLVAYWLDGYDWRAWETKLNAYPQFTTTIDGQNVHFLHVRSPEPNAFPLILTHGWPMSVVEYLDVTGPLSDPRAHGLDPSIAFDLVIPHVPGFGFSGPTHETGWDAARVARAWSELMRRLGYERYGAHGNDGGSIVSPLVGRADPERVAGVHVTQVFSFPSGDPAELSSLTEEEQQRLQFLGWFWENLGAYDKLQSQAPQNVGHAIADSPAGQLAWSYQLFGDAVSDDYILTNVSIYWFTNTGASSARFYYENSHAEKVTEPTTVPLGLASFKQDFKSIRTFAERDHKNIVSWNEYEVGSHYAAHDAPDVLVSDLRGFFDSVR